MDLTPLMKPKSIAVLGASQRMGRGTRVIDNLQRFGYGGRIFPVNPKYPEILGLPCYPDLAAVPDPPDVVVVAIPAEHVPALLTHAADRRVAGAIVLSSGFAEAGQVGRERQAVLERLVSDRGFLVCGPNCYGVFNVRLGSATFSAEFRDTPRPGPVALVSQSGGFSHAIAEHLMQQRRVGLSYLVSCGNQAGVTVEDYVEFLVEDEDTAVIGVFVEGFRQPGKLRRVAALAREREKAIVALKVGRSESARQAMVAHTGSLAGTPEIVEAVLRQSGVVQVTSLNEMIDTLALLSAARTYRRPGWGVTVLSGLGGECGHVADAADRVGVELPPLAPTTVDALRTCMPDFANPRNPLDGTGAMYEDPRLFPAMVDALLHDDSIDVIAINLRANLPKPGGRAPYRAFSQAVRDALRDGTDKLVIAFDSFADADLDAEVVGTLVEVGVPFLGATETAMLALRHARDNRRFLARRFDAIVPARDGGIGDAPHSRGVLPGDEARRLLAAFGIPLVETAVARDAEHAARAASRLGYPVVLKIDSADIAHKTDVGGVRLGCSDGASVRRAFGEMLAEVHRRVPTARLDGVLVQPMVPGGTEMILGVKSDPLFGPAVVCGFGGVFVEVLRDVSIRVPPLNVIEARAMIAELRGSALLHGARGRAPGDVAALAETLVRLAALADAHRERLTALDLNPVLVRENGRGVVAVDWLIEFA